MYNSLSSKQKEILNYKKGTVVVKACPGSGKTFSVSARISKLLSENDFTRKGIAAISFTNVACEEIIKKLKDDFNISSSLSFPHYLGTIDSFLNNYIFLPYGHLIMKCSKRPELVGAPHQPWTKGKGDKTYRYISKFRGFKCVDANPDCYFDCVSFDISDKLIPIVNVREIHFSLSKDKYYNRNGLPKKEIRDLIDSKLENFKLGYANQSDANYISLKILEKYPRIAENIANKFEYFIIDEAQDTDEIQMKIIDILHSHGAKNIMLIGDRDQSIFEWNNAKPELFDEKYKLWDKIDLNENRRSSQKICNFTKPLSSFVRSIAVTPSVANFDYNPEIIGLPWTKKNNITEEESISYFNRIISYFCATCEQNEIKINKENVAIIFRGKSNGKYLGLNNDKYEYDEIPWIKNHYHVKDIIRGKILYDKGEFQKGYKLLEKGIIEAINKPVDENFFCNSLFIENEILKNGFKEHRNQIFSIIKLLPDTSKIILNKWIAEVNDILSKNSVNIGLKINNTNGNVLIDDLFASDLNPKDIHPFYCGTIHSVKGKTFDAVLVLLGKKPGNKSFYSTMITKGCKEGEEEELRNIYVALTRPRKVLMMVVPDDDVDIWKNKLK